MFKRLSIALALMLALCLTLSAAADATKPYEGTTINVLIVPHAATVALKDLIPEFEAQTGIKVNMEYLERVSLDTKQDMELGMGTGAYDVMHVDISKAHRYAAAGWARGLNDLIESADPAVTQPDLDVPDFVPAYLDTITVDGEVYGLPFAGEAFFLYYRTDLFEQAGIDKLPETWEEVVEASQKIEALNIEGLAPFGIRTTAGEGMNVCLWASFLWGYDGRYVDEQGHPVLNSPEALQGTQFYVDLVNEYGPEGGGNMTHYDLYSLFQQGKLAMYFDASSLSTNFTNPETSVVTETWAAAPAPLGPSPESATNVYAHGLMIPTGCENELAAWQFIQWYTSKAAQYHNAINGSYAGITRTSVIDTPEYIEKFTNNNWLPALNESLKHTRPDFRMYDYPEWLEIGDMIGQSVQNAVVGTGSVQENMDDLNAKLATFLAESGYIQ
jgi:multiple sugar transport system substrate-binding protein